MLFSAFSSFFNAHEHANDPPKAMKFVLDIMPAVLASDIAIWTSLASLYSKR